MNSPPKPQYEPGKLRKASSRKHDAVTLEHRVLDRVESLGMRFRVLALRNKDELGKGIYCHFILEITR